MFSFYLVNIKFTFYFIILSFKIPIKNSTGFWTLINNIGWLNVELNWLIPIKQLKENKSNARYAAAVGPTKKIKIINL